MRSASEIQSLKMRAHHGDVDAQWILINERLAGATSEERTQMFASLDGEPKKENEMLNDNSLPPQAVRDSANALFKLISVLADKGAKQLLGDLAKQADDATTQIALAASERKAVDKHAAEERARLAAEAQAQADRLAAERDEHEKWAAAKTAEITAREIRSKELADRAAAHELAAIKARTEAERRLKIMETGAA